MSGVTKCVDLGGGGWSISNDYDYNCPISRFIIDDYNLLESNYKRCLSEGIQLKDGSIYNWLDISLIENCYVPAYVNEVQLAMEKSVEIKAKINQIYQTLLPSEIQYDSVFNSWRFNIRVDNSRQMLAKIFEHGLFASRHYQPVDTLFSTDGCFSNAKKLYHETVNLFNDRYFSEEKAIKICEVINFRR